MGVTIEIFLQVWANFIEINLNCNLWSEKVMAKAASHAGFSHADLLETLLAESWRREGLVSVGN